MQKHLIVSTCGTSILTNGAEPHVRSELIRLANRQSTQLSPAEASLIRELADIQRKCLAFGDLAIPRQLSAELNGILGIYDNQPKRGRLDQHVLIHTDTFQGQLVAEIIQEWLEKHGLQATCQGIPQLTTADLETFHAGMNELVTWADATIPGFKKSGYEVIFNLVGGFKSIQGFMQTLGMFYADELVYIFESSDKLLRLPRLPIDINQGAQKALRENLFVIRTLDAQLMLRDAPLLATVPETFLYHYGTEVDLSAWGRLVWKQHKHTLYEAEPLPSLSPRLVLSPRAVQEAARLPPERIAIFNERMDDLAIYLEGDCKDCPKRLDFKKLRGNPSPPATHECDLWADADTLRAFGRFDGEQFVVEWIGRALH